MSWFSSKGDPSPPEDPNKSSADNLVKRSCMCTVEGCECGDDDVYVQRSVKVHNVRCPGCAGGYHPGAYK